MFNSITKAVSGAAIAVALGSLAFAAPALASSARAATPQCSDASLKATYAYDSAGAGHSYGWIRLTNTSNRACVTGGYGGISYVGHGNGTQIGAAATRDTGRVAAIVLQPGQHVASPIDEVTALNFPKSACRPTPVNGFRIYVPNSTRSQYVVHPTIGCANTSVKLMSHRPYQRG